MWLVQSVPLEVAGACGREKVREGRVLKHHDQRPSSSLSAFLSTSALLPPTSLFSLSCIYHTHPPARHVPHTAAADAPAGIGPEPARIRQRQQLQWQLQHHQQHRQRQGLQRQEESALGALAAARLLPGRAQADEPRRLCPGVDGLHDGHPGQAQRHDCWHRARKPRRQDNRPHDGPRAQPGAHLQPRLHGAQQPLLLPGPGPRRHAHARRPAPRARGLLLLHRLPAPRVHRHRFRHVRPGLRLARQGRPRRLPPAAHLPRRLPLSGRPLAHAVHRHEHGRQRRLRAPLSQEPAPRRRQEEDGRLAARRNRARAAAVPQHVGARLAARLGDGRRWQGRQGCVCRCLVEFGGLGKGASEGGHGAA